MGTWKRRTSCGQPQATAIFPAHRRAAPPLPGWPPADTLHFLHERRRPNPTLRQALPAAVTAGLVVPGMRHHASEPFTPTHAHPVPGADRAPGMSESCR